MYAHEPVHREVMTTQAPLVVAMLGPPSVTWAGRPLSIPRRQVRALLYVLASSTTPVSRDALCALFWPDVTVDVAVSNLSRLLYFLQRALPEPAVLQRDEEVLGLDSRRTWVDARALVQVLEQPSPARDALRAAASLYRGAFLDGFDLPRSPAFSLWLAQERRVWERRYLALLSRLIDVEERLGHYQEAIQWAQRYLSIDELAEHIHRRLILLYAAVGDRRRAARQFEQCVLILERELGIDPLPETRAAFEAAMRGRGATTSVSPHRWQVRPSLEAPFVGRDTTLSVLGQAYMRARTGRGTVVFIRGEPGIGKTRLLQEFTATLPSHTLIVHVAGSQTEQDIPYAALVQGLRDLLPHVEWPHLPVSPALLAEIARLLPDLRSQIPDLSYPPPLSPGYEQQRLFQALSDLFTALARRYPPLVLCVDDMHWLDASTRAWLGQWLPRAVAMSVLVLVTYRPEGEAMLHPMRETLARRGAIVDVPLEGLDLPAVEDLCRHLWQGENTREMASRLSEITGGNPFFLLEILRGLQARGGAAEDILQQVPLPPTVEEAVQQRLTALPPRERHVLETAAVLGYRFPMDLLVETSGYSEEEIALALDYLVADGLLREEGTRYRFIHQLVRDLAYARIGAGRRQLLHRRAAQALLHHGGDPATIARHFQLGGCLEDAVGWWTKAGDRARLLHAYDEATRHYERALALQRDLGDTEGASRTLMRLGLTHHLAFRFAHAATAYEQGFDLWQRGAFRDPSLPPATHPLRLDWPHVRTLDPALCRDPNSGGVIEHLFSGLAEWDPDMNVVPDLARGWDVLAEGRQYVFYLREDATWSDGRPVRAEDFVLAWQRVLHPKYASPYARLLFPLRNAAAFHRGDLSEPEAVGVRALDDLTLVVELEHPCSFFPHLIAHPVLRPIPVHVLEQEGERWWHPRCIVTNGPFKLMSWKQHGWLHLARAPLYRGRWPGNVEEIHLHLGLDQESKEAKWHLYQRDELDVFTLRWGLPTEMMERIRRQYAAELVSVPNFFVRFLGFNTRRPPFDNPQARRAFALAINRRTLASILGGDLVPAHGGMIPPDMPGHTPDLGTRFDPLAAQRALREAGFPRGRGFPEVTMLAFPAARALAEYLQQAWERILRVSVRVVYVPWDDYVRRLNEGPVPDIFLAGWVADYPDPDNILRVNAFREWTGWRDKEYIALLHRATRSTDEEERIRLYRQADAILVQQLPVVPLLYSRWTFLLKPWVKTLPLCPLKWWFWKDAILT